MKHKLIILLLTISYTSFSQEKETYQVDSVMKMNKVKTKIRYPEKTVSKAEQIYNYDKEGRLIEYILTDNYKEDKIQFKVTYQYNEQNKLVKEIDSSYSSSNPTVEITKYSYESNGDFKAIQFNIKKKKKIISETFFQADSNKETHKLFKDNGDLYRENISYYERPNYTYKFAGSEKSDNSPKSYTINGKEFTIVSEDKWQYLFTDTFDSNGRIIERVRTNKNIIQDKKLFVYDSTGLLLEMTKITYHNGKESKGKELFKYIKWN